mmetsp:Transcript_48039/g.145085  ORF Transcript_48039/g.145085 Transcript_48039/m.145085 type:complete len:112 (-) Transcript_48039:445-780(-)
MAKQLANRQNKCASDTFHRRDDNPLRRFSSIARFTASIFDSTSDFSFRNERVSVGLEPPLPPAPAFSSGVAPPSVLLCAGLTCNVRPSSILPSILLIADLAESTVKNSTNA